MVPGPSVARYVAAASFGAALLAVLPATGLAQRTCRTSEVVVAPPDAQFQAGANYPFQATAYDAAGNPCDATVRWISSNSSVVTINSDGIATGVSAGHATITARTGSGTTAHSGTASVTVSETGGGAVATSAQVPGYSPRAGRPQGRGWAAADRQPDGTGAAENILLDPLQLQLVRGESRYLDFRAVRADGSNAAPVPLEFAVDPGGENIIAVDTLGLITSRSDAGAATVRVSIPNQVRIQPKLVRVEVRADTVRFNRPVLSLVPGAVETLSLFIPAQSRALNPGGLFQFLSSDTGKIRVNPAQPIVEARGPGSAQIIAQSGLYPEIRATINVHRRVASLRLDPTDSVRTIAIGATTTVRAAALDASGQPIAEAPLTWRSPDTTLVSFDLATGAVRGRHAGEAIITVFAPTGRDSAVSRQVRIHVVAGGLAVSRPRVGLNVGQRAAFDVQLLDDQRRAVMSAMSYLVWTSSADTVARVEGLEIAALQPGHARLTGRAPWDSTVSFDVYVGGEMVAVNQHAGRYDLAMYWAGGANWKPLSADSLVEMQPAWSPDLTRLAYAALLPAPPNNNRAAPRSALWVMNVDGSGATRLTDDSSQARYPSWLGNDKIVFEWNKGGSQQVWLYEFPQAAGTRGATRVITTSPAPSMAPDVSPAGDRIAYVSLRQISGHNSYGVYSAAMDGTDERLLTSVPQGQRMDQPTYTPDGRAILFLRSESGRQPTQRVYRFTIGGAATDTAVAVTPPTLFVRGFSISADGGTLALSTLEPAPNNRQVARLVMYTIQGGATTVIGAPEDELSSPVLRPGAPAAAPTSH